MKWGVYMGADMGGDFELAEHMVGKLKITWDVDSFFAQLFCLCVAYRGYRESAGWVFLVGRDPGQGRHF